MSGIREFIVGDTFQITWIDSSFPVSSLDSLTANVLTGSETIIDTGAMVDSGDGRHFFFNHTAQAAGYYLAETVAIIAGVPIIRRERFQSITLEVD